MIASQGISRSPSLAHCQPPSEQHILMNRSGGSHHEPAHRYWKFLADPILNDAQSLIDTDL